MLMNNVIELSNKNIINIIGITISVTGAMGESDCLNIVTKDMMLYHLNLNHSNIKKDIILEKIPLLKTIKFTFASIRYLEIEWKWFYMGHGNYFIIRNNNYKIIKDYIDVKLNKQINIRCRELYQNWYNILKNAILRNNRC